MRSSSRTDVAPEEARTVTARVGPPPAREPARGTRRRGRRLRGDDGFVGGAEAILFGVLVLVVGSLLMTNAWAVVDARMAASSAARETARAYVESDGDLAAATAAGRAAFAATSGLDAGGLAISAAGGRFGRCVRVTITAEITVPALSLPFGGGWGDGFEVSADHSEIVDPYRAGLEGEARCDRP